MTHHPKHIRGFDHLGLDTVEVLGQLYEPLIVAAVLGGRPIRERETNQYQHRSKKNNMKLNQKRMCYLMSSARLASTGVRVRFVNS